VPESFPCSFPCPGPAPRTEACALDRGLLWTLSAPLSTCTQHQPTTSARTLQHTHLCPLPLQHCEERPDSWVTADQFKAGLAVIHAMPGPMFNLSAYLGAVMAVRAGWNFSVGVAACWLGLFGPGIVLLYGLLPFWGRFRQNNVYRRALPGLSAAAVGLVVMAVFSMYNSFTCVSHALERPGCPLPFHSFPFLCHHMSRQFVPVANVAWSRDLACSRHQSRHVLLARSYPGFLFAVFVCSLHQEY
jgi:fumarate reductase subunit D